MHADLLIFNRSVHFQWRRSISCQSLNSGTSFAPFYQTRPIWVILGICQRQNQTTQAFYTETLSDRINNACSQVKIQNLQGFIGHPVLNCRLCQLKPQHKKKPTYFCDLKSSAKSTCFLSQDDLKLSPWTTWNFCGKRLKICNWLYLKRRLRDNTVTIMIMSLLPQTALFVTVVNVVLPFFQDLANWRRGSNFL